MMYEHTVAEGEVKRRNVNIKFNADKLEVYYHPDVYTKFRGMLDTGTDIVEVLGILIIDKLGEDTYLIKDVIIPFQECTASTCELGTAAGVDSNWNKTLKEIPNRIELYPKMKGWAHTHPGMSNFHSGTDKDTHDEWAKMFSDGWSISVNIAGTKENFSLLCRFDTPQYSVDNVPMSPYIPENPEIFKQVVEQVKTRVTRKTYMHLGTGYMGYSWPPYGLATYFNHHRDDEFEKYDWRAKNGTANTQAVLPVLGASIGPIIKEMKCKKLAIRMRERWKAFVKGIVNNLSILHVAEKSLVELGFSIEETTYAYGGYFALGVYFDGALIRKTFYRLVERGIYEYQLELPKDTYTLPGDIPDNKWEFDMEISNKLSIDDFFVSLGEEYDTIFEELLEDMNIERLMATNIDAI